MFDSSMHNSVERDLSSVDPPISVLEIYAVGSTNGESLARLIRDKTLSGSFGGSVDGGEDGNEGGGLECDREI